MFDLTALIEGIQTDQGLEHAVLQSLLNHAKAKANDPIHDDQDHQGWWANEFVEGVGCRDWTLSRSKHTPETLQRAKLHTEIAIQWLIEQGYATEITVSTHFEGEKLIRNIQIQLNDRVWETTL